MTEIPPVLAPAAPADRRTLLVIAGIVQVLLGCLAFFFVFFVGVEMIVNLSSGVAMSRRSLLLGVLIYLGAGTVLFTLGIGSILAKRWARALSLIFTYGWLYGSVFALAGFCLAASRLLSDDSETPLPPPARAVALVVMAVFFVVFFLMLPGFFLAVYHNRNVKATCERRHPQPGWTDACPLPVLFLSLWQLFTVLTLLAMLAAYHGVLPMFGTILHGVSGAAVILVLAALTGYGSWQLYHLRLIGWRIQAFLLLVNTISALANACFLNYDDLYHAMGNSEQQIAQVQRFGFMGHGALPILIAFAGLIPLLALLVWIRPYFPRPRAGT